MLKHFVLLILEVKSIWEALASRLNVLWFYLYTCWHCSQWRNCYLCDFHDGFCHLNDCWVSLLNGRSRGKWSCQCWVLVFMWMFSHHLNSPKHGFTPNKHSHWQQHYMDTNFSGLFQLAQLDLNLGHLEASWTPTTLCHVPWVVAEQVLCCSILDKLLYITMYVPNII